MRYIDKATEPATVTETRCAATTKLDTAAHARGAFDQLDKAAVRKRLAAEQGFLCGFCMRRIGHETQDARGEPTMKIAHRMPIDADHSLALTWKNLIGSCDGGQRSQGRCWTCDAAQGSKPLSVDPTEKGSVGRLAYGRRADASGLFVTSDDEILRTDVDHTLKLNSGDLPALRDAARKAFQEHCRRALATRGRPAWKQAYPAWLTRYGDALPEFLGAIEALL